MFIIYTKEICKRFCVSVYFHSVGCIPKSGIARSYGTFMFNFLRHAFFKQMHHGTLRPAMHEGANFSTFSPAFVMVF